MSNTAKSVCKSLLQEKLEIWIVSVSENLRESAIEKLLSGISIAEVLLVPFLERIFAWSSMPASLTLRCKVLPGVADSEHITVAYRADRSATFDLARQLTT